VRVPPPGQLRLDRLALLEDVRERLGRSLPQYANAEDDPADPGWLLLEQSAWIAELLSEQLDKYPFSVVQHFVHMTGGHLRPSQPSVGVLAITAKQEGVLNLDPRRPSPWRFYSPQDEDNASIEFTPVESGVSVRLLNGESLCRLDNGELAVEDQDDDAEPMAMWRGAARASRLFAREFIRYEAVTTNADTLMKAINGAIERLEEKRIGWIHITAEKVAKERVAVVARVEPHRAFKAVVKGDWICPGGDLEGDWGTLDGSTWTPDVVVSDHPMLPPHLRGKAPLPGYEEGQIVIPDVPENCSALDVLVRKPTPIPESVVDAIWQTLVNLDSKLAPIRPSRATGFDEPTGDEQGAEPNWVAQALSAGVWADIEPGRGKSILHVSLTEPSKKEDPGSRFAVVYELPDLRRVPGVRVYGIGSDGKMRKDPSPLNRKWRLPGSPLPSGAAMPATVAYDVELEAGDLGYLVVAEGDPKGFMLNALMVSNMAPAFDGRNINIRRNVPLEVTLMYEDLVTPAVVDQLLEQPFPPDTAKILRDFSLAHFSVSDQDPIADWTGVKVDATDGGMVVNAPDRDGEYRTFRPGVQIKANWYRWTSGAAGNQPAGRITIFEHPSNVRPTILAAHNPVGTFFGADREDPEAAVERLFSPTMGTPVLPSDFERQIRLALGTRAKGWYVRVWTHAERSLVSSAMWPFGDATTPADPEVTRVEAALGKAGPETLFVVVGQHDAVLSDEDLDWARRVTRRYVRQLSRRLPALRDAIVTRFWPLKMVVDHIDDDLLTPTFRVGDMTGELEDPRGYSPTVLPPASILLNAAVVTVQEREEERL